MSPTKRQVSEAVFGVFLGTLCVALWWFVSFLSLFLTVGKATSGALFVTLSYLWLILIFASCGWLAHHAEKHITRNVVVVLGCVLFLLNTSCWVGFRFGWFRIGG